MAKVIRQERGWAGHHICSNECLFRRNTLLTCGDTKIVVSTVGNLLSNGTILTVGDDRYYETIACYSNEDDKRYNDIDIDKRIEVNNICNMSVMYADDLADEMHERVVDEITKKLRRGSKIRLMY